MHRVDPRSREQEFRPSIARIRELPTAPIGNLRRTYWWLRKTFFTRPRSRSDSVVVRLSPKTIKSRLGKRYFEPGWEFSYQYRDEILNMRRVEYDDALSNYTSEVPSHLDWWQVHIRGYPYPSDSSSPKHLELTAHFEPEPTEYPDEHVSKRYIDLDRGMETLLEILDNTNTNYRFKEIE